jgi:hypothetical protein
METTVEVDDAISSVEVRRITRAVRGAVSTTFQEGRYFEMVANRIGLQVADKPKHERVPVFNELYAEFKDKFQDLDPERFVNKSSVLMYSDVDEESGNSILNVYSNTGTDVSGRSYAICFMFDFGENKKELDDFVAQTQQNPLFVKSIVERIFSPDGDPKKTFLGGQMEYGEERKTWYNLSPFIKLGHAKVFAKDVNQASGERGESAITATAVSHRMGSEGINPQKEPSPLSARPEKLRK